MKIKPCESCREDFYYINNRARYCESCKAVNKKGYFVEYYIKNKEKSKEKNRIRYDYLKSRGRCVQCGKAKAEKGKTLCLVCAEKVRKRQLERKHKSI